MAKPNEYNGTWKKRRYAWKKNLATKQNLTGGAKLLGTFLCDTYANSSTGCCFPSNKTLAEALGVSKRTVQRHMRELIDGNWIKLVHIEGRRRGLQLVLPVVHRGDTKGDNRHESMVTHLASQHVSVGAPYIEPKNNLSDDPRLRERFHSFITVHSSETQSIEAWKGWLCENVVDPPEQVLESVACREGYKLPCRFPKKTEAGSAEHREFFKACRRQQV